MCVSQDAEVVQVVEEPGEPAPPPKDPPGCWERFKVRSTGGRPLLSTLVHLYGHNITDHRTSYKITYDILCIANVMTK